MAKKKFYVTTPIYYANAEPHVGSAYTTIAADVLARWHRLKNEDVFFLTGTDEHGQKIQETAEKAGVKPKEFVDKISLKFKEAFKLLNVSNDYFIRTTEEEHEKSVKRVLQKLYDAGMIYKGSYEAYYCVGCEQYLTETDLIDGKCPLHNREPELRREESYLFKLSHFQDKLLKLIESGEYCILPERKRKEIVTFISNGLKDISVSRLKSKVYWGIELPFDRNHCCFVWIDAFWNYVSGLESNNCFKKFWPADVQLMANDILRVHATIWPALLLATKNKLPKTLFVHGYFTVNGKKMSKSLGNVINPVELAKKYPVDAVRYFLFRDIPFGEDGDFSEEALKARYNNELANDLGNLVSRVLTLAEKNFNKGIKKYPVEKGLAGKLNIDGISRHMDELELHLALQGIMGFVKECNRHINNEKLWERKGDELEKHLYSLLEGIRITSLLLTPFIPESAGKINKQLGISSKSLKECEFGLVKVYNVKKEGILFKKVEGEKDVLVQNTPKLSVSPYLKKQGINVAAALITDAKVANRNSKLEGLKKDVADKILGGKIDNAKILNGYKEFYDKAGMKECVPAAENLIKLVKKGKKFPEINTIVDCYNLVSAETGLSLGAHDMNFIKGGLVFRETRGDEKFIPLGEKNPVKINKGEYAFMDEEEVLCRMDIKQGDKTKITKNTKSFIIYAQGNKNVGLDYLQKALKKACILLEKVCGAKYQTLKVE
ncbi:MAG TPA: methionine--tRNA ligase [Candidatus Nanoarchaeia archaeon]|nr:methionine--tRNA ligase [Candidatus Nanoarchaeia archaeon]